MINLIYSDNIILLTLKFKCLLIYFLAPRGSAMKPHIGDVDCNKYF